MGNLKRYESFELLKAEKETTDLCSAAKQELPLKSLFANLRCYKVIKRNSQEANPKLNGRKA